MKFKTRTWLIISLLCFVAAAYFWRLGNEKAAQRRAVEKPVGAHFTLPPDFFRAAERAQARSVAPTALGSFRSSAFPLRVANTPKTVGELSRLETGLLLRHALLDTSRGTRLEIPEHLRSTGEEPGSYVVQAKHRITTAFHSLLQDQGVSVVAYIPNNAFLVTADRESIARLSKFPAVQATLPYDPYFKLSPALLALAVDQEPMPEGAELTVLSFPGKLGTLRTTLAQMGASVTGFDSSPFGEVVHVKAKRESLVALAQLPQIQLIEPRYTRSLAVDLARPRMGVSTNDFATNNWLGLTGSNVTVNVNDSGIESAHPHLTGRVTYSDPSNPDLTQDPIGHGTHVAGIIGGAPTGPGPDGVPGSLTNNNFGGFAPQVRFFAQPIDLLTGPLQSDRFLQTNAASRAGVRLSNNSWGYLGATDYTLAAASYDAAVRDSQPGASGSQAITYVFAAGNEGVGGEDGTGGEPDSIRSPATAKNVITVTASENLRQITNTYPNADGSTNSNFLLESDGSRQIASYASRGNAGVGVEGDFGRFKPDVVAPGSWIISARSSRYTDPTTSETPRGNYFPDQRVEGRTTNSGQIFVPGGTTQMRIRIQPNGSSPNPFPALFLAAGRTQPPNEVIGTGQITVNNPASAVWFYEVGNSTSADVAYDLQIVFLISGGGSGEFAERARINERLKPNSRFESGTSMAAPAVTGVLALFEEFFQRPAWNRTLSPALNKALLINGARSLGNLYDRNVNSSINYQGWGLVNLTNSLPGSLTNGPTSVEKTLTFFDQSPVNTLSTGERHRRTVSVAPAAASSVLRATLVWTDPPGNPGASIKLVNDLDLVMRDLTSGEIFYGNFIPEGDFTAGSLTDTNAATDVVNNVENVFIDPRSLPGGKHPSAYEIAVVAKRVNVNAVSDATIPGIKQDYALVISMTDSAVQAPFTTSNLLPAEEPVRPPLRSISSGIPLLQQRVGANNPTGATNSSGYVEGSASQWNFYVMTNSAGFPNVAFITFQPPNLSKERNVEADIDLYVSQSPALTNLDATVVANALKSTNRFGNETIVITNSSQGDIFYVGVKSEDQQAAVFGMFGVASQQPFSQRDEDGNLILRGVPVNAQIPDGSADNPQAALVFAISSESVKIRRVTVTNTITHQSFGDLLGNLSHNDRFAVLNNHSAGSGTKTFYYDDSDQGEDIRFQPVDGPGSLNDFIGEDASGAWQLTMVDNSPDNVGQVDFLSLRIEPQPDENTNGVNVSVAANRWYYDFVDVGADATNLVVSISFPGSNAGRMEVYLRKEEVPDQQNYDKFADIFPPGGSLNLGLRDVPPLSPGRYYVGVFNPNAFPVDVNVKFRIEKGITAVYNGVVVSQAVEPIADDATTLSAPLTVTEARSIADLAVSLRVDHPRLSDMSFHLVSPAGTRALLFENRGANSATSLGIGSADSLSYAIFTENTNRAKRMIKFASPPYAVPLVNNNIDIGGFEPANPQTYGVPTRAGGWDVRDREVGIVSDLNIAHSSSNFLALAGGTITYDLATQVDRDYTLSFVYRDSGIISWYRGETDAADTMGRNPGIFFGGLVATTNGYVGQNALFFDGADDYVLVNNSPTLSPVNGITIEAWIFVEGKQGQRRVLVTKEGGVLDRQYQLAIGADNKLEAGVAQGAGTNPYTTISSSATLPLTNWTHVAMTFDRSVLKVYINGTEQGRTNGLTALLGGSQPLRIGSGTAALGLSQPNFHGRIDELGLFNRGLSEAEVRSIFTEQRRGKNPIMVPSTVATNLSDAILTVAPNPSVSYNGDGNWRTGMVRFVGLGTSAQVEFKAGAGRPGILLDSFKLNESGGGAYFLPEESLAVFRGENAEGQWRLEMRDSRVGPAPGAISPQLLKWRLQLNLAQGVTPATRLNNGVSVSATNSNSDFTYFIVEVPASTRFATNRIVRTSGTSTLDVYFNQNGLPTGNNPDDVLLIPATANGSSTLSSTSVPQLQPGQRYYIGVRNSAPGQTTAFTFQVDFDRVNSGLEVTPLEDGILYKSNMVAGARLDYYQFDVTNSAVAVAFELLSPAGDVNLVVRKGLPLPNPNDYDYNSVSGGLTNELIVIDRDSTPLALSGGRWYLGVYNLESNAVSYGIRATQSLGDPANPSVITLTNRMEFTNGVSKVGAVVTNWFRYVPQTTDRSLIVEVYDAVGDVDLVVTAERPMATVPQFDVRSFRNGAGVPELAVLRIDADRLVMPSEIFIGVPNREAIPVQFKVRVSAAGPGETPDSAIPLFIRMQSAEEVSNFRLSWNSIEGERYEVQVAETLDAVPSGWTVLATVRGERDFTVYEDAGAFNSQLRRYYRVVQKP